MRYTVQMTYANGASSFLLTERARSLYCCGWWTLCEDTQWWKYRKSAENFIAKRRNNDYIDCPTCGGRGA